MRNRTGLIGLGLLLAAAILTLASCGQASPFTQASFARALSFGRAAPPAAPLSVSAQAANTGSVLAADAWTNASQVALTAAVEPNAPDRLVVEAEFRPEQQPLSGIPNAEGEPGQTSVLSPEMEPGERYHWALRLRNSAGSTGPWLRAAGAIGYQPTPPPAPAISPLPRDGWVGSRHIQVSWKAQSDAAGTAGFAYSVDQSPAGALPVAIDTRQPTAMVAVLKDGDWYLHVRTIDGAGNASPVTTLALHVDSAPLSLEPPKFTVDGSWNPVLGPLSIEVRASKAAHIALSILPEKSPVPIRTFNLDGKAGSTIQWDGKDDRGQAAPAGAYRVQLSASDKTGRSARATAEDLLPLTNKRIVVSLSQERMVAYEGDKVFLDTLVTTGGPELPTPTGTFHVLEKRSPFTFKSPWPKGSPFWYPDSPTTYAMLFESSGYFIHDAPWRSWFGPGSNAVAGKPGGDGTGTHGCVNVPLGVEARLYGWTTVGTPVIVIGGPIS